MNEITVPAQIKEIETVTNFVDGILEEMNCPIKAQMQIDVAIDEILSNIIHYGCGDKERKESDCRIKVRVDGLDGDVGAAISFIDNGIAYNPLTKEDPDITLSVDERPIGGLGIFIVKKTMDDVTYSYENGCNVMTVTKNF